MPCRIRKRKSHIKSITLRNGNKPKRKHPIHKTLQRPSANLLSKRGGSPNQPGNPNKRPFNKPSSTNSTKSIHDSRRLREIPRKYKLAGNMHTEHG